MSVDLTDPQVKAFGHAMVNKLSTSSFRSWGLTATTIPNETRSLHPEGQDIAWWGSVILLKTVLNDKVGAPILKMHFSM